MAPEYDLLFGQQLGKIPHTNITIKYSGGMGMRIYYAGDAKQDQKIAFFAPDKSLSGVAHLSYGLHTTPIEIAGSIFIDSTNKLEKTVPIGAPMDQTRVMSIDNQTQWFSLDQKLLDFILTQGLFVSGNGDLSGIQDGVPFWNILSIDATKFEDLVKNHPEFKYLFGHQ